MLRSIAVAGCIAADAFLSMAFAADDARETADQVLVTATRYPVPVVDVLPTSFVIERDELQRSLATDISDVLRFRSGIEFGRTGGPGQTTSLFMRGTESNHTLVLLDGVRINPGTIGGAALQNIAPQLIDRIEVVKGPRSTLYGTDAIGGVVQIFTHASRADGIDATVAYGTDSTIASSATGGWNGKRARVGFGINYLETDGYPPRLNDPRGGAYDELSFNLAGSLDLGSGALGATYWRTSSSNDYIGFSLRTFDNAHVTQDAVNEAGSLHYDWTLGDWHSRLEVSRMVDDLDQGRVRDDLGSYDSIDYATTHRNSIGWQNDFTVSTAQRLSAGISVIDEKARTHDFGTAGTDIVNVYAQDQLSLGKHEVVVAGGYVDHETTGGHATWNVDYGVHLTSALRLIASAGTAFRAPDATDRFGFGGNPQLQPEESTNYELGLRYAITSDQRISVSAFQNDIDQLVTFVVTNFVTFDGRLENIDRARIRGIEAGYAIDRTSWSLRAEAIYQDPEDRRTGEQLLRRAQENFTLSYWQRLGRVEVGIDLLAAGERKDFGGVDLDAYALTNLKARLALSDTWSLLARIENVFDEDYTLADGYRTQDRAGFIEVRYATAK